MLVVNDKEIPVYKLDTEKTIILRIARKLNTLKKYLYGLPDDIFQNKKIKVLDLLSLIKNQESTDIKDFIEENKDKFSNLNINIKRDVVDVWLSYNKTIEELSQYSPVILDQIGDVLAKQGYFSSANDFLIFWNRNRQTVKRDIENKIAEEKRESQKYIELYEKFEKIENGWVYTEFNTEKVTLNMTLNLTDITLLELFNYIVLNRNIPFAVCKNYYKILKDYIPPDDWNIEETDYILLKMYEKEDIDFSKHKDITNVQLKVSEDEKVSVKMKLITEKGYLSREQFIHRVLGVFSSDLGKNITYKDISETEVIGIFYFPQQIINTYVFSDLVMNDLLFSSLINIDESSKATKKKTQGSQPWLYIHFTHPSTGKITAGISQKIADRTQAEIRDEDAEIFPHGEPYIRVRVTGSSRKEIDNFQEMFSKLLVIYSEKYNEIVTIYEEFIPDFGVFEQLEVPELKQSDLAPEVFVSNFSRSCSDARRPTILSDTESEKYEGEVMVFPRDKKEENGYPSDGLNQKKYVCLNPEYPYPGLIENNLSNSVQYPYLPCCFKTSQSKKGGIYRSYYFGEKVEIKEKKQQDLIITDKILGSDKYGVLPENLQKLFNILDSHSEYKYIRVGVHRNKSSFLNSVMVSLNDETAILELEDEDERLARLLQIKEELSDKTMFPMAKQSCYDMTDKNLSYFISDENTYMDPKLYTQLLEGRFNCNIFTFNKNGMFMPRFTQGYYREKRNANCVFIYEHWGSESDKAVYPQCEIIIRWNTTNKEDTQYVFPYDQKISKNINKVFKMLNESYCLNNRIKETVFPLPDSVKIKSQKVDNYGKTRCLNIVYKNKELTILTSPMAPLPIEISNKVKQVDKQVALEFLQDLGIKPTGQVLENPSKRILIKINSVIGNVDISIPVNRDNELGDVPVVFGIRHYENKSTLETFNFYKKIIRYITEYLLWLFSTYLQVKNIPEVTDSVLADFAKQTLEIEENHEYKSVPKNFNMDNSIVNNGKLVVKSEEMAKRLMYVLKLYSIRDMKTLREYHSRKGIKHYYEDITDFDYHPNQVIIQGEDAIDKWRHESRVSIDLHEGIVIGTKSPYFFKNKLVENEIFLAQNTNSLQSAITIGITWQNSDYNMGVDVVTIENYKKYGFNLYSYVNENDIVKRKVVGQVETNIRILGYKLKGTPTYTVLLKLK